MPNYAKGKIYKIISDKTDKVYIGSTTLNYLKKRLTGHKSDIQRGKGATSNEIIKYNDSQIILIENFPCATKDELLSRERYWIEQFPNCVNKYKKLNQTEDDIKNSKKEWYQKHKNTIAEKNKQIMICTCGQQYTPQHKVRHEKTKIHQNFINSKK